MSHDMYSEIILDYYRHPRLKGGVEGHNIRARDTNPSCGDVIEMQALVQDGVIKDIKYDGKGCAISQAAASMLCEHLLGKPVEEVNKIEKDDILTMLGIPISGIRLKCALLGLKVIKYGTYEFLGHDAHEEKKEPTGSDDRIGEITTALKKVVDPELHMDIVTLGLLRDVTLEGNKAHITMTLTSPMCPFGQTIVDMVKAEGAKVIGIDEVIVDLEFDPPWEPPEDVRMMLGV